MLRSINSRFYTIAVVLVLIFAFEYTSLAYYLRDQRQSAVVMEETVFLEREIHSLHDLFHEIRFWERAILFQRLPEADKQFGEHIVQMRKRLSALYNQQIDPSIQGKLKLVSDSMIQYETYFNDIIQSKTEQRLHRTRMDTSYRSLVSFVLRSDETLLLKPLFNLTHFLISYRIDRLESEYQALNVVIGSLDNRITEANLMDNRVKGYINSFRDLLDNDYALEREIRLINDRFNEISTRLTVLFKQISRESENLFKNKFQQVQLNREKFIRFFFFSTVISLITLLMIITLISKKIIKPIRSVSSVMREVKAGDIHARSEVFGNEKNEIVQFGLSFNDMLDTLEKNNQQLVDYQNELGKRVSELAHREKELEKHRNHLEELIRERTSELTEAVEKLREEIVQRQNAEQELQKHREDLESTIKKRTADLSKTNRELELEIAGRKKAERERQRLAIQLQRAGKMEALGTLAGGVAHDLNNILSGIVSYPELLLLQMDDDSPFKKPILTIKESGQKAATVVQDLLTLARRGVAITNVVNLNNIITEYLESPEFQRLKSFYTNTRVEIDLEISLLNIVGSSVHLFENGHEPGNQFS